MVWCTVHPDAFSTAFEILAQCLAIVGAVVSADFIVGRQGERIRRVNWSWDSLLWPRGC